MREVCASSLLRKPVVIGGPGKTVEVDGSCFSRRKFDVGRVYRQQWVFGVVSAAKIKNVSYMLYQTDR